VNVRYFSGICRLILLRHDSCALSGACLCECYKQGGTGIATPRTQRHRVRTAISLCLIQLLISALPHLTPHTSHPGSKKFSNVSCALPLSLPLKSSLFTPSFNDAPLCTKSPVVAVFCPTPAQVPTLFQANKCDAWNAPSSLSAHFALPTPHPPPQKWQLL
jgi:hypothetical protein